MKKGFVFDFLLLEVAQCLQTWQACADDDAPLHGMNWYGRPLEAYTAFKLVGLRRLLMLTARAGEVATHEVTRPLVSLVDGNDELLRLALSACDPSAVNAELASYVLAHPSHTAINESADREAEAYGWSQAAGDLAEGILFGWLVLHHAELAGRGFDSAVKKKRQAHFRLCDHFTELLPRVGEPLNFLSAYVSEWRQPAAEVLADSDVMVDEYMFVNQIRTWVRLYNRGWNPAKPEEWVEPEFETLVEALNRRSRPWNDIVFPVGTHLMVHVTVGANDWLCIEATYGNTHTVWSDDTPRALAVDFPLAGWSLVINGVVTPLLGVQMALLPATVTEVVLRDPAGKEHELLLGV